SGQPLIGGRAEVEDSDLAHVPETGDVHSQAFGYRHRYSLLGGEMVALGVNTDPSGSPDRPAGRGIPQYSARARAAPPRSPRRSERTEPAGCSPDPTASTGSGPFRSAGRLPRYRR